ncbi:uncharacterized protein LOC122250589 [Penaeus japonicus]|uniref:uncharacterized protein LOC122250589 n=1 Tax=Penaeus japonicus TaxID=27405 RepID=UPI001C70C778|nr:uncharacterized protein LOC122250589 [Penaeus japonicus]
MFSLAMPGQRLCKRSFAFLILLVPSMVSETPQFTNSDIIKIDGDSIVREDMSKVTRIFYAKLNTGLFVNPENNTTETTPSSAPETRDSGKYETIPVEDTAVSLNANDRDNTSSVSSTPDVNISDSSGLFGQGFPRHEEERAYIFAEEETAGITENCETSTLYEDVTTTLEDVSGEEYSSEDLSDSPESASLKADTDYLCDGCEDRIEEDMPVQEALYGRPRVSVKMMMPPEDSQFYLSSSTLQDLWQNHINAADDIPYEIVDMAPSDLVEYYLPPPDSAFVVPIMTSSSSRISPNFPGYFDGNMQVPSHTPTPMHVLPRPPLFGASGGQLHPIYTTPSHYPASSGSLGHILQPSKVSNISMSHLPAQARTPDSGNQPFMTGLANVVGRIPPSYVIHSPPNMPTPVLINTMADMLPEFQGQPSYGGPGVPFQPESHGEGVIVSPHSERRDPDLMDGDETRVVIRLKPGQSKPVNNDQTDGYSEIDLTNGQKIRIRIAEDNQYSEPGVPNHVQPPENQPPLDLENRPPQSQEPSNTRTRPPQNQPSPNRPLQIRPQPNMPKNTRQAPRRPLQGINNQSPRFPQHRPRPNNGRLTPPRQQRPNHGVAHAGVLPVMPIVNVGVPRPADDRLSVSDLQKMKGDLESFISGMMANTGGNMYQPNTGMNMYQANTGMDMYQTNTGMNMYQTNSGEDMYQSNQGGNKGNMFNKGMLKGLANKFNKAEMENLANKINKDMGGIANKLNKDISGLANKFNKGMGDLSNEISPIIDDVKNKLQRLVNPLQTKLESSFDSTVGSLQSFFGNVIPPDYYEKVLTSLAILAFLAFVFVRFVLMYNSLNSSITIGLLGKTSELLNYLKESDQFQVVYELAADVYESIEKWSEDQMGLPSSLSKLPFASSMSDYIFGGAETKEAEDPVKLVRKTLHLKTVNETRVTDAPQSTSNPTMTLIEEADAAARLGVALVDFTWQFGRHAHPASRASCLQRPLCEINSISDRQKGLSGFLFPLFSTGVSWMARPPEDVFSFLETLRPLWLANTDDLGEGCRRIHSCNVPL